MSDSMRDARLTQWMTAYGDAVYRLCFMYLSDRTLAEDAMQETFLRAWKRMHQQRGNDDSVRPWLMRIAVNICHDYHRSRWFRHVDTSRSLDELPTRLHPTAEEDRTLLLDVIRLPEKYKQVILLYYYQELTIREVAGALRISAPTVHYRLKKAQEQLKRGLTRGDSDGE